MKKDVKGLFYKGLIVVTVFWILDFGMHFLGVGESKFYFISKFANAVLFSVIWFGVFQRKEIWKKLVFSFVFGTWISFYYLVSSYSGLVQWLGIYARYSAPPFVFGSVTLSPFLWWIFHIFAFFIGIEIASRIIKK